MEDICFGQEQRVLLAPKWPQNRRNGMPVIKTKKVGTSSVLHSSRCELCVCVCA